MKIQNTVTIWLGITAAAGILLLDTQTTSALPQALAVAPDASSALKTQVLDILEAKCNICHRKQNPLMIFREKNIVKRAPKIHDMVFVKRRMPKGDKVHLTTGEYATLEKWLLTQNIN